MRRANDYGGMMRRLQVRIDGTRVAALKPNEQSIVELDAGPHVVMPRWIGSAAKTSRCRFPPKGSSPSRCHSRSHPPSTCSAKRRELSTPAWSADVAHLPCDRIATVPVTTLRRHPVTTSRNFTHVSRGCWSVALTDRLWHVRERQLPECDDLRHSGVPAPAAGVSYFQDVEQPWRWR